MRQPILMISYRFANLVQLQLIGEIEKSSHDFVQRDTSLDPSQRGPDWTHISPAAGSLFHEKRHASMWTRSVPYGVNEKRGIGTFVRTAP